MMKVQKFVSYVAAVVAFLTTGFLATAAGAAPVLGSLDGKDVQVGFFLVTGDSLISSDQVTVSDGSEIDCLANLAASLCQNIAPYFEVDFVSDSVTVWHHAPGGYGTTPMGFRFGDLDFGPDAVLASVTLDTNIAGLDDSYVSLGDDFVLVALTNLMFTSESYFSLVFNLREVTAPVPAPAGLALFGLALLGLMGLRGRRS